jgi:hypothetical protein
MYKLARRYGLTKLMKDETEVVALILACYCHDLDHRGLTNSYLKTTKSLLSDAYRHSIMEEHHANFAVSILTAPECDILENLPAEDFKHVLHMMRANIVSTDLSVFFQRKGELTELITSGKLDIDGEKPHRRMVRGLLMNCCDLMAMALPFRNVMGVVRVIYLEFFTQGDREKAQGLQPSSDLMDRDKEHTIPQMQIGFINGVVLPAFRLMAAPNVLPRASELVDLATRTVAKWERWIGLGADYRLGCTTPWPEEEEVADDAKVAPAIAENWRRFEEEDEQEKREEEKRQIVATSLRRQSMAAANVEALRRTSAKVVLSNRSSLRKAVAEKSASESARKPS